VQVGDRPGDVALACDVIEQDQVAGNDAPGRAVAGHDLASELGNRLKEVLGVKFQVRAVESGALEKLTGLNQTSKVRRLIDNRAATAA